MRGRSFGGSLLQKQKSWSIFPLGLGPMDLDDGEEVFRGPWSVFKKFLTIPLRSQSGAYLNTEAEKKMSLKSAYTKLGRVP